jgi:hypothetical protein
MQEIVAQIHTIIKFEPFVADLLLEPSSKFPRRISASSLTLCPRRRSSGRQTRSTDLATASARKLVIRKRK